ncbi:MAG: sulfotransferase family protein [Thermoanaerobaculia bacterium]|nr:sulfotransferase family protein [Thermoanaerobaculia bacterium]
MTVRINLWSGPRNVSTALMYSFAQRPDTRVVDEPLYAHYLRLTGADHPEPAKVLASQESDGEKVVRELILGPCDRPVLFLKQMAHHLVGLDHAFLADTVNVLLIRDPAEVLPSLVHLVPEPILRDTGLAVQSELLDELRALGQDPPVVDSRELLLDPAGVLEQLCQRIGIPFDEAMLSWEAGPRPEDGVWAPHWYQNVHRTTGFRPYRPKTGVFPERLEPLLEECRPYYAALYAAAIKAAPTGDAGARLTAR